MDVSSIPVLSALAERVAPRHTALLVIDMQNDYVSPGGASDRPGRDVASAQAMVGTIRALVECAHTLGVLVIFTRYTVGPGAEGLSGPEVLRRGLLFGGELPTVKGTWGHELIDGLGYRADVDVVIDKRRPSSFLGTDLEVILRGRGVQTLVVVGLSTAGCVESTVRDASGRDYYVAVVEDATAASDPEAHRAALLSMTRHLRYPEGVVPSSRLLEVWAAKPARAAEVSAIPR